MTGWLTKREQRKANKRRLSFALWYARGYEQGSAEMKQYLTQQVIYAINHDAVLTTNADVDTLERVVEVIEAVRDLGKA